MRVLVLTNLYPPHHLGGYELACADVVRALGARGHRVTVLTSWRGLRGPTAQGNVVRALKSQLVCDPPARNRATAVAWQAWNRTALRALLQAVRPDVVHVFNPSGLGASLLVHLHSQATPVVHDVSDTWLLDAYGQDTWLRLCRPGRRTPLKGLAVKTVTVAASPVLPTAPAAIDLRASYFRSRFLRQRFVANGFDVGSAPVIYHGIRSPAAGPPGRRPGPADVVFSGRLTPEKGASVLLEALHVLRDDPLLHGARVTLAGPATSDEYRRRLQALAGQLAPALDVQFTGHLPRARAVELLREHSLFAFPVLWDEPFSIALLEAMAVPLAVVATCTGGSSEILADGENSLVVPRGDPQALASALRRLAGDPALRRRLADGALRTVRRFPLDASVDGIEGHLRSVSARG